MKPTNQLFDIIKSLTPEEEKKFILLSSLQQGEKNYIKLYNFIQKQDSYDEDVVKSHFKNEIFIAIQEGLTAISISLPEDNSKIAGLYYHFFKRLAWEGVVLYEVISTTNEFTILVEDEVVDKAFSAVKGLKN